MTGLLRRSGAPRSVLVLGLLAAALGACEGAPVSPPLSPSVAPPPPTLSAFQSDPPSSAECFAEARPLGVPGFVPIPPAVHVQGPDDYAGPYAPLGRAPQRIIGRGFAYEVSSRVSLVAGFYGACLDTYRRGEFERLRAEDSEVLFEIPQAGRLPVVVLIADNPEGPTAVVVFTDYTLEPVPPPPPSLPASPDPSSPEPADTASPG